MATAYKIATAWEDGGPAQVGKAITITSNTGGPVTLYQSDGVTTAPNPVTTTLVDATAQVITYVIAAGRYLLTGVDGVQKALQVSATVTTDPPVTGPAGPAGAAGAAGAGALVVTPMAASGNALAGQFVTGTGGAPGITVTLPAPVSGSQIVVKKVDAGAGAVTVTASAAALIDGAASRALAAQYNSVRLLADGINWQTF